MRETEEGIKRLREGIRLSPLDERAAFWRTLLARALYRLGRFGEAADEARQACRRSDTMVAARVVLAVIEIARGNVDAAVEAMGEARRIEPNLKAEEMRPVAGSQGMNLLRKAGMIP
jgi:tetratricopeptide (TPR) repeat protein